jgi:hypothetical protein
MFVGEYLGQGGSSMKEHRDKMGEASPDDVNAASIRKPTRAFRVKNLSAHYLAATAK